MTDTFDGDHATMSMAHTARVYYLALTAEDFTPAEALALTATYMANLLAVGATMPQPTPSNGPTT